MRMTGIVCALLALIAIPTASSAQNSDAVTLAGLRSFSIVIANVDEEDETNCAVGRAGLYTALRSVLGQSEMIIADNARAVDGTILLQATVLSNCAANIALKVQTWVTIDKSRTRMFAPVWERERLRTGFSGRSAGVAIRESVEDLARLLVNEWSAVNK